MNPKYPVFIPSKGRVSTRLTMKAFDKINVPYTVFVEEQEYDQYSQVIDEDKLHVLPHQNKGLVVTRNYIWDYAESLGTPYFWTFDDNIRAFYRLNRNQKARVADGTIFRIAEDFHERYDNLAILGFQYELFTPKRGKYPPLLLNTRIYSNMLIRTDIPFRNEGFYNDDTDLCIRVLKAGWCTCLFYAFLAEKENTMQVKGGMTPHYLGDGRLKMAQELQRKHPDVVEIVWKWKRWQHKVDYRPFRGNRLIKREGVEIPEGINEYGMQLVDIRS